MKHKLLHLSLAVPLVILCAWNRTSIAQSAMGESVLAWGGNGQMTVPVAAQSSVTAIAAGDYHTVALKSDGSVVAWGNNLYGQTTIPLAAKNGVTAIAAGGIHTVALKNDGSVVAWGYTGDSRTTVPLPAQSGVTAIAAGGIHTVALVIPTAPNITTQPVGLAVNEWRSASFVVVATGYPLNYQWRKDGVDLAGATSATYSLPFAHTNHAGDYTVVVSNSAGSVTSAPPAVLKVSTVPGTVVAWGWNWYGPPTVPAAAQSGVTAIAAGGFSGMGGGSAHTVALKDDGTVVAWGSYEYGQETGAIASPLTLGGQVLGGVTAISAGVAHTVALKNDGSLVAWGRNPHGQVTGTPKAEDPTPAIASPVTLGGQVLSGVTAIAAGHNHTVALKNDGSVVAWGYNESGQVTGTPTPATAGNPYRSATASPVTLGGEVLSGVMAIAAGSSHTVALKNDGSVVAWGSKDWGATTVPVAAQSGVMAISAGTFHTVALKNDGSVVAWGGADPVPVAAQSGVTAIAAGYRHTVALKSDGSVVAWGWDYYGQVTGTPAPDEPSPAVASPVTLGGQVLRGVTAIAVGPDHTVALIGGVPLWPSLKARPNGHELILSWPTNAPGFTLQSTPDLTPPITWLDSTNLPAVIGTHFTLTNSTSGDTRFYRLRNL